MGVSFALCSTFDECRRKVIAAVDREFPGPDPLRTTEVDVVGVSMGGIVARYAALRSENADARRLRVARLFTISSPHLGADRARLPAVNQLQRDMRADSAFIRRLNRPENAPAFPVFPYVRLGDHTVGAANAAPVGMAAWWVPDVPLQPPHSGAVVDARIIADIARRLRGEAAVHHRSARARSGSSPGVTKHEPSSGNIFRSVRRAAAAKHPGPRWAAP